MDIRLSKRTRRVTTYAIAVDGKTFEASDLFETIDEILAHGQIVLTNPDMVEILTAHGGLATAGSKRWMSRADADETKLRAFRKRLEAAVKASRMRIPT